MSAERVDVSTSRRVAAITGAGSGLGHAMAILFAKAGYDVAVMDIDEPRARETAAEVQSLGRRSHAVRVDISDQDSVRHAAQETERALGPVTTLCANVGVQQFGAIERLTALDWQWVLSVNVGGPVNTVTEFLPVLRRATGKRHIVLTASSSVFVAGPRIGAYVASKCAVVGIGETLRIELAPEGIGVTVLFPAGMATRHLESSVAARPTELGPSALSEDDVLAMLDGRKVGAEDVVTPEYAVRNLLDDLDDDQPYVFTHGDYREELVRRGRELLAAFDRQDQRSPSVPS